MQKLRSLFLFGCLPTTSHWSPPAVPDYLFPFAEPRSDVAPRFGDLESCFSDPWSCLPHHSPLYRTCCVASLWTSDKPPDSSSHPLSSENCLKSRTLRLCETPLAPCLARDCTYPESRFRDPESRFGDLVLRFSQTLIGPFTSSGIGVISCSQVSPVPCTLSFLSKLLLSIHVPPPSSHRLASTQEIRSRDVGEIVMIGDSTRNPESNQG